MKKYVLAFLIGSVSGFLSSYFKPDMRSIDTFAYVYIFGLIFGIFSMPFVWNYTQSYKKTILWFIACEFSYVVAYWIGFALLMVSDFFNFSTYFDFIISHWIAGILASAVLLSTYHNSIDRIQRLYFSIIITIGGFMPAALVAWFGVSVKNKLVSTYGVNEPYELVLLTLWEGVILLIFVKFLANQQKNNI